MIMMIVVAVVVEVVVVVLGIYRGEGGDEPERSNVLNIKTPLPF